MFANCIYGCLFLWLVQGIWILGGFNIYCFTIFNSLKGQKRMLCSRFKYSFNPFSHLVVTEISRSTVLIFLFSGCCFFWNPFYCEDQRLRRSYISIYMLWMLYSFKRNIIAFIFGVWFISIMSKKVLKPFLTEHQVPKGVICE